MTIQNLEQMVEEYGNDIYSFCVMLTGRKNTAEELYQDIWLYACKNADRIDETGNVKSYLLSVAIHHWNNERRKFQRRQRIVPEMELRENVCQKMDTLQEGLSHILKEEQNQVVAAAVDQLKEKYRLPVLLFYGEGMTLGEIAETLKIPAGTVKSRLHYAKKCLKKELEDYMYG